MISTRPDSGKIRPDRLSLPLLLVMAVVVVCGVALPQGEKIHVESLVEKATVTVGDSITYSLVITRAPGIEITPPDMGSNLGRFEIRDYQVTESAGKAGDDRTDRYDYIISIYDTGEFEIPPVTVGYRDQGEAREIRSQPIHITVNSVLSGDAEDIKDIKPPLPIKSGSRIYLWVAGLLLLAAAGLWFWRRKRDAGVVSAEKTGPPRPAHEIAYEEFLRIEALGLIEHGQIKEHYTEVSEVLRRYIGRRYHIMTLELTTAELAETMADTKIESERIDFVRSFLEECDLVKFAKHVPLREEMGMLIPRARTFVDATRETLLAPAAEGQSENDGKSGETMMVEAATAGTGEV